LGGIAGGDDGLEGFAFVLQVSLCGFDEVRDEVVPAFQLNIDLGERVFIAVPQADEGVVLADNKKEQDAEDRGDDDKGKEESTHAPNFAAARAVAQHQRLSGYR
jgi:hypothetical protein